MFGFRLVDAISFFLILTLMTKCYDYATISHDDFMIHMYICYILL